MELSWQADLTTRPCKEPRLTTVGGRRLLVLARQLSGWAPSTKAGAATSNLRGRHPPRFGIEMAAGTVPLAWQRHTASGPCRVWIAAGVPQEEHRLARSWAASECTGWVRAQAAALPLIT